MKRGLWRFFGSLKLAVILLIALTVVLLLGTLFPQLPPGVAGDSQASARWLGMARDKYGALAGLYETLGLFNLYRSPGFALLITALILNTLVCSVRRFEATWRAITARPQVVMSDAFYFPPRVGGDGGGARIPCHASLGLVQEAGAAAAARRVLARRRYRVLAEEREEVTYLYADRNRWARLGTLITHLSVVLIVSGFVWSQGWGWREPAVALGPGQLYQVGHGHSFRVRCDGFEVERYADGLPKDYRARLTVLQGGAEVVSKIVRVNEPLSYRGVVFHLSSYGPAARAPAYDTGDAESELALDRYVVLQVVSDPGFKLVIFAAFLFMGGLILSLYFPHRRIWAKVTTDVIHLAGLTVGDRVGFERELAAVVRGIGG